MSQDSDLIWVGEPQRDTKGFYWVDEIVRVTSAEEIVRAAKEIEAAQKERNPDLATKYKAFRDKNGELFYGKEQTRPIEYKERQD